MTIFSILVSIQSKNFANAIGKILDQTVCDQISTKTLIFHEVNKTRDDAANDLKMLQKTLLGLT